MKRISFSAIVTATTVLAAGWFAGSCLRYGEVSARFDDEAPAGIATRTVTSRRGDRATLIRAAINGGQPGWFMLESSSYFCTLDAAYLAHVPGLSKVSEIEIAYPCKIPVTVYRCKTLTAGPLTIQNLDIAAFDMSSFLDEYEEEIVGWMGVALFEHAVVEIGYGRDGGDDRVAVYDPDSYRPGALAWQPLGVYNFQPVLQSRINRTHSAPFVVDTNYNGTVAFYSVFNANYDILEGRPKTESTRYTVCGESPEWNSTVRVFEFAGNGYNDLAVSVLQPGTISDVAPGRLGGFIGRGLLADFDVVFDMPNGRIALPAEEGRSVQLSPTPEKPE